MDYRLNSVTGSDPWLLDGMTCCFIYAVLSSIGKGGVTIGARSGIQLFKMLMDMHPADPPLIRNPNAARGLNFLSEGEGSKYYLLTPWSRVLLEKLAGSAASQEIPRLFETQRFITVFTSARHLSLS